MKKTEYVPADKHAKAEQAREAYQIQFAQAQQTHRFAMRIHDSVSAEETYDKDHETALEALNVAMRSLEHMAALTKLIHS